MSRFFQPRYIFFAFSLVLVCCAVAQDIFTPVEQQQVSVETPGLFERSNAFTVDFSTLSEKEYSFPLPVGKGEVREHSDIEVTTVKGDAVKAMFDGTVRLSRNNPLLGNVIVVRHANGLETVYANNAQNLVKVGQKVKAGETVAIVGQMGEKYACLVSVMVDGRKINPETILDVKAHRLRKQMLLIEKHGQRIKVSVQQKEKVEEGGVGMVTEPFAKGNVYRWNLAKMGANAWHYPLPNSKVISPYGGKRNHAGVDLKTKPNDQILAAFDGVVTRSGPYYGYGNCIVIRHPNGLETLYSHQSKNLVKVGQKVKAGDVIGLTGRTGRATTEHLHLETSFMGKRFNPNVIFNHARHALQNSTIVFTKKGKGIMVHSEPNKR